MTKALTFIFSLLTFQICLAFDVSPEYQGLSEADLERFEAPTDINSEYQIIWNGYINPLLWSQRWQQSPKMLNLSLGSLSNNYFLQYAQAKFTSELTDNLNFQFTYLSQRDQEIDQSRHVLEMTQKLSPKLRLSIYGEPSHYKRENDIGLAFLYSQSESLQHRFFYTWHDFTRNNHNNQPDKFKKGHSPDSAGWLGTFSLEKLWGQAGLRFDRPTEWLRPQEERIFRYWKKLFFADFRWNLSETRAFELRSQWDSTFKEESPDTPASTVAEKSWQRERSWLRASYFFGNEDFISYEAAMTFVARRWTNQNDKAVDNTNDLAGLTARMQTWQRADRFDYLQLGIELAAYQKDDPDHLTTTQKNSPHEARLQSGYEMSFKNNASLLFALNFDVDDWNKVPSFEGGSGQFSTQF